MKDNIALFGYIFYRKNKDMDKKMHKLTVAVTTRVSATGFYSLSSPPRLEFVATPVIYLFICFGALIFPC